MNYTITYKENPCGGILSSSSGFIASPNFPNRYSDEIDCAWLIKIEEGQTISVNNLFYGFLFYVMSLKYFSLISPQ